MKISIHVLLLALVVITTKADDSVCDGETSNLSACELALVDQGAACVACYINALGDEEPATCQEGADRFCAGFVPCMDDCGNCVDEVYALLDCVANDAFGESCNIDCQGSSGAPPTAPPSTTPDDFPPQCEGDFNAVVGCLFQRADQGAPCLECVSTALPADDPGSCQAGRDEYCANFSSCSDTCGDCVDEVNGYVGCLAEDALGSSCNLDCQGSTGTEAPGGTESPIPAECVDTVTNLIACQLALPGSDSDACQTCWENAIPEDAPGSCQEGEDQFCAGFDPCKDSCGDCVDEVLAVMDCAADNALGNCNIDCQVPSAPPPVPPPVNVPTTPPVDVPTAPGVPSPIDVPTAAPPNDTIGGTGGTDSAARVVHWVMTTLFSVVIGAMVAPTFI